MYESITDTLPCIDAIERNFGTSHAEQAAHLYEETSDLDVYNRIAVEEIIEYLTDYFDEDTDAVYIRVFGRRILKKLG